jgi:hypothetical protein
MTLLGGWWWLRRFFTGTQWEIFLLIQVIALVESEARRVQIERHGYLD